MTDESQVRSTAYELWEQDGRPEGMEDHYWYLARARLEANGEPASFSGGIESGVSQPMPAGRPAENGDGLDEPE